MTPAANLQRLIKNICAAIAEIGLLPIALICDQGTNNASAINSLREKTRREQILRGVNPGNYYNRIFKKIHLRPLTDYKHNENKKS